MKGRIGYERLLAHGSFLAKLIPCCKRRIERARELVRPFTERKDGWPEVARAGLHRCRVPSRRRPRGRAVPARAAPLLAGRRRVFYFSEGRQTILAVSGHFGIQIAWCMSTCQLFNCWTVNFGIFMQMQICSVR